VLQDLKIPVRRRAALRLLKAVREFRIADGKYLVKLARTADDVESALALRHRVFDLEIAGKSPSAGPHIEFDEYDFRCRHLIVIEISTGKTVGTYRINSIETAERHSGFYSYNEFTIEDLPDEVLKQGMEIGRACIAQEHRNSKVLFLLWKGLATFLQLSGKRYFFGCCSIFTNDERVGRAAFEQLKEGGHFHSQISLRPRTNGVELVAEPTFDAVAIELPPLFNMYLRIGAKVCSPPMIDRQFGTIDFFVIFDLDEMNPRYRKMFFAADC
jgi:putative hemolysin